MGPLLLTISPKVKYKKKPTNIKQILVIRPGGMGDAALLLPVLKEVKLKFPKIKLDILCESRNSGVFSSTFYIEKIFHYDNPIHLHKLFKKKYEVIIDTEQSHFLSAFLCRLLNGNYKIGYETFGRGKLFNKSIPYRQNRYEAIVLRELFTEVFSLKEDFEWNYPYFRKIKLEKGIISTNKPIVCLFPGATKDECKWPEEKWAELIDKLDNSGFQTILLGGKLEIKTAEKIIYMCYSGNTLNYTGKLSLLETTGLFESSKLLISTDSGILHMGVLSGIATVSLFGAGNTLKWGPFGLKHTIIQKAQHCSPCALFGTIPECRYNNACMTGITVHDILNAASGILNM